jgi:hypothetical protein
MYFSNGKCKIHCKSDLIQKLINVKTPKTTPLYYGKPKILDFQLDRVWKSSDIRYWHISMRFLPKRKKEKRNKETLDIKLET